MDLTLICYQYNFVKKQKAMKKSINIKYLVLAFVMGLIGSGTGLLIFHSTEKNNTNAQNTQNTLSTNVKNVNLRNVSEVTDFTQAANNSLDAVVHIKTEYYDKSDDPLYNFFFGKPNTMQILKGSGSGVIISNDGYIVTNNHVIDNASNITVILNNKDEYEAKLIGTDKSTDIALLKIDADSLKTIQFGNSDDLQIGQWVLAIGNPFNLTSTVTAGIISAKARNININNNRYAIESFIQTDAAVNPGNSGGALINTKGELVGINTAIASPTGSFTGYSFAIPSNIVQKVVSDLIQYGEVHRAFLGVSVSEITKNVIKQFGLPNNDGILITNVVPDGAADKAGIKEGDVILKLGNNEISEVPQLLEKIGLHKPGDKITLTIRRKNKIKEINVTLTNETGGTKTKETKKTDVYGATFRDLTESELEQYKIDYGVKVENIMAGKFLSAGIKKGYIITKINDKPVHSAQEAKSMLSKIRGGVYLEGFYPQNGMKAYYAFGVEK